MSIIILIKVPTSSWFLTRSMKFDRTILLRDTQRTYLKVYILRRKRTEWMTQWESNLLIEPCLYMGLDCTVCTNEKNQVLDLKVDSFVWKSDFTRVNYNPKSGSWFLMNENSSLVNINSKQKVIQFVPQILI